MIGADNGDLRIDKEGSATVTATETKADGSSEAVAWVKVISKAQKLEEIKLFIDGQDVTNQTCQVAGSEEKKIEVKAKYQGSDAFVPANSTRFAYKASDDSLIKNYNDSSSFSFKKPGTAKMVVTSKVNNSITAEVEVTSTYVPATSVNLRFPERSHSRKKCQRPGSVCFPPRLQWRNCLSTKCKLCR